MPAPFVPHLLAARDAARGPWLGQLATVSASGDPEVRTVVVRGLLRGAEPYLASDARSAKVRALVAVPRAELCLWRTDAGEQLRLRGPVARHDPGDPLADRVWSDLSPTTRATFFGAEPATPLDRPGPDPETWSATVERAAATVDPPATFVVLRLTPTRVDRLLLGPPLRRSRWWADGAAWRGEAIAP